jgi:dual specificity MAP kinase phosphatase
MQLSNFSFPLLMVIITCFFCAASQNELLEYELKLFGPSAQPLVPTESFASLGFGYEKPAGDIQAPMFNQMTMPSIFERVNPNDHPTNFTFGAERIAEVNPHDNNSDGGVNPTKTENLMDGS